MSPAYAARIISDWRTRPTEDACPMGGDGSKEAAGPPSPPTQTSAEVRCQGQRAPLQPWAGGRVRLRLCPGRGGQAGPSLICPHLWG